MISAHQGKEWVSLEEQMMLHSQKENGVLRDQVSMETSLQLAKAQLATEGEEDPSMLSESQNFSDEMQTVKPDTILKQTTKEEKKMIMKQGEQIGLTFETDFNPATTTRSNPTIQTRSNPQQQLAPIQQQQQPTLKSQQLTLIQLQQEGMQIKISENP